MNKKVKFFPSLYTLSEKRTSRKLRQTLKILRIATWSRYVLRSLQSNTCNSRRSTMCMASGKWWPPSLYPCLVDEVCHSPLFQFPRSSETCEFFRLPHHFQEQLWRWKFYARSVAMSKGLFLTPSFYLSIFMTFWDKLKKHWRFFFFFLTKIEKCSLHLPRWILCQGRFVTRYF